MCDGEQGDALVFSSLVDLTLDVNGHCAGALVEQSEARPAAEDTILQHSYINDENNQLTETSLFKMYMNTGGRRFWPFPFVVSPLLTRRLSNHSALPNLMHAQQTSCSYAIKGRNYILLH